MHETLGHPGGEKLFQILRPFWQNKDLKRTCYKIRRTCLSCLKAKPQNFTYRKVAGTIAAEKNEILSSDILGPYYSYEFKEKFETPKTFIITLTDILTRFTRLQLLEKIDSISIIPIFRSWSNEFGRPKKIISDRGKQYLSRPFKDFLNSENVQYVPTMAYHPEGNDISERVN